jgi:hypothetical protein
MSNTWSLSLPEAFSVIPIESEGLDTSSLQNVRAVSAHAEALTSEYVIVSDYDDPTLAEVQATRDEHYRAVIAAHDTYIFEPTSVHLQTYLDAVMSISDAQGMRELASKSSSVNHQPKSRELADRLFDRLMAQVLLEQLTN